MESDKGKKESLREGTGPAPWGERCEEGNVPTP